MLAAQLDEEAVFNAARKIDDPAARAAYLRDACPEAALRERIEALLAIHDQERSFLNPPGGAYSPTVTERPLSEAPGTVIGPYKLLEQIGEGGFGVVFMAEQTAPVKRKVALKVIKPGMDTRQVIARFEAERQALALMDHPNIARVFDGGETASGRPYFVMELVKGVPITDYCDQNQLIPCERLELFITVCQAVQHAHQKGIIHRDIKPTNVLVTMHDDKPLVKVIDFGIAKATSGQLTDRTLFTGFAQLVGTPLYMSPEQAALSGIDVDTRSDIYSLGVVLYELLTGTTPFDKTRLQQAAFDEVRRIIREEEPQKPSTRLSSLGDTLPSVSAQRKMEPRKLSQLVKGDLDWIVMKALEKDRARRYETANGFAADVLRYLVDEPVSACPPSAGYRLRKFVRRNKGPALATALVLLALVGGVIGTTVGMLRAEKAERDATDAQVRAERERDGAIEARQETFDALIDLSGYSAADALARNSESSQHEREFFERVAARYERLAAALPDTAETQGMRAKCLQEVGSAYFYVGDHDRALRAYGQSAELLHGLRDRTPDDPAIAHGLTACLTSIAAAYSRLERHTDRERALSEAIAAAEEAHRRFPFDRVVMCSLSLLHNHRSSYRWEDAVARLDEINEAISLAEKALRDDPEWPHGREVLAHALAKRCNHYAELGGVEQVQADTARVEELAARGDSSLTIDLAGCQCRRKLGDVLWRAGSAEAAVAAYRNTAQELEAIIAESPGAADPRAELIRCYDGLQDALRRSGRGEESERYARLVLRLKEGGADAENVSAALFSDLSRRTAALAAHALGEGRTEEAHEFLDRAIRYDRRCLDLAPLAASSDTPESRAEFRRAAARAGELAQSAQRLERWGEAIEFARRQLDDARAALGAGERPDYELFVCLLNGSQTLLTSLVAVGQIDTAGAAWDETLRVIAWSDPGSVNDAACHQLAEIAFQLTAAGNAPEPSAALAPGLAERQAKLTVDSAAGEARMDLRRGYRAAGLVLEKMGRFQEADDAFARVIDLAPIPPDGPDQQVKNERHLVFGALIGRAICLDALEREADAESAWQALYTFTGSTASAWLHMRFQSVARNGRIERAIRLAEQLVPTAGNVAMQRYSAACVYAIASTGPGLSPERKEELARRAVEQMEECKAAGGLDDPQELEHAKSDADLDPLRGREDFQRLFGSM